MDSHTSFNLIFDPSEDAAIHWAARTGMEHALDLRTAEQLYARALPYIKNWAWALTAKHGWTEDTVDAVGDMPLAVCLGRDALQGVNGDRTYVARLVLPLHFSDLLDPEFANDWAAMFSHLMTSHQSQFQSDSDSSPTDIFQLGRAGIPRPLQNILYLLQILSPGLLVLRSMATDDDDDWEGEDGEWGPQGIDLALPPSIWVGLHIEDLEDIFGAQTALKLYQAAEDPYCASEEVSSFGGSYGSQGTSDHYTDSSDPAFFSEPSEEEWPSVESPEIDQDDVYPQYSVPFTKPKQDHIHTHGHQLRSDFDRNREYGGLQDHNFLPDIEGGKASNGMEYRHCDSDCGFCGLCSSRFADRLTERLLMHVL